MGDLHKNGINCQLFSFFEKEEIFLTFFIFVMKKMCQNRFRYRKNYIVLIIRLLLLLIYIKGFDHNIFSHMIWTWTYESESICKLCLNMIIVPAMNTVNSGFLLRLVCKKEKKHHSDPIFPSYHMNYVSIFQFMEKNCQPFQIHFVSHLEM